MHLELFRAQWGEDVFTVTSYSASIVAGILLTVTLTLFIAHRRRIPMRPLLISLAALIVSVPIGARLLHWLTNPDAYLNVSDVYELRFRNFALYGGILLGGIMGYVMCRLTLLDPWRLADSVTPGICLGIATIRLGCYLNGCCFGLPSSSWGAVTYPNDSPVFLYQISQNPSVLFDGPQSVYPTQLYELCGALIAAGLALWLMRKEAIDGIPFLVAALFFTMCRAVVYFFRARPATWAAPDKLYPLLYAIIILLGIAAVILRLRMKEKDFKFVQSTY
ncbi:Prolipoprotein diacylglyceryl transferase [Gimesia alba]|uniref:Prolipoprotein diacylglyceryl transferase n=1 Tax=Gimesia alba TaxID=2527973 RepID=A0A517RH46_9PLAN|nr:prolipoprotein diacylglyceryl transferase family protein [Gimesia alba]QDT43196.1 Prolipoprotein diacylglyceryl transferase [Gimesia alba]